VKILFYDDVVCRRSSTQILAQLSAASFSYSQTFPDVDSLGLVHVLLPFLGPDRDQQIAQNSLQLMSTLAEQKDVTQTLNSPENMTLLMSFLRSGLDLLLLFS